MVFIFFLYLILQHVPVIDSVLNKSTEIIDRFTTLKQQLDKIKYTQYLIADTLKWENQIADALKCENLIEEDDDDGIFSIENTHKFLETHSYY